MNTVKLYRRKKDVIEVMRVKCTQKTKFYYRTGANPHAALCLGSAGMGSKTWLE